MPGTLLLEDAQNLYAERLKQHAQQVWDTISSAPQQAVSTLQSVSPQVQELAAPVTSAAPDPSAIIASLQQHAQDAWQNVQQAPQQVAQAVQPTAQAVDPTAVTQRLMQHAQDAFQSVDQNAQPIGQGLQQAQPTLPPGQTGVPGVDPRLSGGVQPPTRVTNAAGESTVVSPPAPAQASTSPAATSGLGPIDNSSPSAFARSFAPYAQYAASKLGLDPTWVAAMAGSESNYGKAAGNELFGVKALPGQPGTTMQTHEGEYGGTTQNATFASYDTPKDAVDAWINLIQNHYKGAVNAQDLPTFIHGLRQGGYFTAAEPEYLGIVKGISDRIGGDVQAGLQGTSQAVGQAVDAAKQTVGGAAQGVLPALSQFGDKQLTAGEAYAACGPAAAVRFAQMYGRNPTLREATDLASGVGWTEGSGMAGLQSESKLFDQMGIPHRVVGADWQALQREAQSGNPVTISTPGHYFTADSYDPSSGAFHVGSSGTDLRGGSEWMTPAQMEQRMGALQGGLAADNPGTPAPSPISAPASPHPLPGQPGGLITPPGQYNPPPGSLAPKAVGQGLQNVDTAVQSAVSATAEAAGGAAGAVGAAAGAAITRARSAAEEAAAAVEPTVKNAADLVNQAPLPFGAGKVSDVTELAQGARDLAGRVQTPDETTPLPGRVAGTGLSALGTVAKAVTDQLDQLSIASTASREAAGEDVYGQKYATAGGPQLEDEYRTLLAKRMAGDDSVSPRMTEIAGQLQQINDTIRAGRPVSEVQQRLSEENPLTPVSTTLTNLGALVLAAPLAAGEAPLVARALAEIIAPGTNPVALGRAVRIVEQSHVSAPQLVDVLDQVKKMPGTAELAPVRQQVTQSSTDLLQAMLDAAKAKGVAPEKLQALEQQITAMDPAAATRRALTPTATARPAAEGVTAPATEAADRASTALRQAGSINPRFAADIGGAAAGGYAGYQSTPEDASPLERGLRTAGGAALGLGAAHTAVGLAGFRGSVDRTIMENLRNAGVVAGPPRPAQAMRGFLPEAVEQTKQMLLTGPTTHIGNVIGGVGELGRLPVSLALGGRADDALASLLSVGKAFPQAAGNALSALGGLERANMERSASRIPLRYPVYRALSAADAFVRTLGEYQGMSAKANQLLRDAGMKPSDPGVQSFLASHSADIFEAGRGIGSQTVFGQAGTTATASNGLERAFRAYSTFKEGMLKSPNLRDQALGALLDFEIPFSGVPVRMVSLVASRTPPGAQIRGAVRAAGALRRGDLPAAQQAIGETAMESTIQLLIAKNIADGNIRGPDDPDHPLGVHMPGLGWVDTKEWGGYALPMQIMAGFAEGYEKGGQNIPAGTPGASPQEQYVNYYGPRFDAALKASMKPFAQAVPGMSLIRTLATMAQGDLTGAGTKLASDAVNRMVVPGAARFVENLTDPVARDVAKKGVKSIYEPAFAGLPGLAELLPEKIDPTTGEVAGKRRAGPGILIGQQQDIASPLSIEADRLKQLGYNVAAPKTYPSSVTIAGSQVDLKPDEQRAVAEITGKRLATLGARIEAPEYQNLPNTDAGNNKRQAMLKAIINAADVARVNAAQQVLGKDELRQRIAANRQIGGRLVTQAAAPSIEDTFTNFSPTGEHILSQRALAGSR